MFKRNGIIKDLKGFFSLKQNRKDAIEMTDAKELPKTYGINELASIVHPGYIKASISKVVSGPSNTTILTLKSDKFPYFRAGQYVTLSLKLGDEIVTRPYSIYSSIKDALNGKLEICVQNAGFFSNELSKLKVNDSIIVSEPSGDFYFDNIRNKKNIVAIAGGSGITPFVSMARSIDEGSIDFNLTIIYGVKTLNDVIYDFKDIKSKNVKVIIVLSDEVKEGYLHGFITKDILKDYVSDKVNVFMCGPDKMYDFVRKELKDLKFDESRIRCEHNSIKDLKIDNPKEFSLTVHMRDNVYKIKSYENETLLSSMEKSGLYSPSKCRSGICGFCHSRLIKGDVNIPDMYDNRRMADKKFNYIHPCATYPLSDVEIEVPLNSELKELLK